MSEWLKEHAWKACVGETLPWVRIPLSPPNKAVNFCIQSTYGVIVCRVLIWALNFVAVVPAAVTQGPFWLKGFDLAPLRFGPFLFKQLPRPYLSPERELRTIALNLRATSEPVLLISARRTVDQAQDASTQRRRELTATIVRQIFSKAFLYSPALSPSAHTGFLQEAWAHYQCCQPIGRRERLLEERNRLR